MPTDHEEKEIPLACMAFNYQEDLKMYPRAGCEKTSFGTETDRLLSKLPEQIKSLQKVFDLASKKNWSFGQTSSLCLQGSSFFLSSTISYCGTRHY